MGHEDAGIQGTSAALNTNVKIGYTSLSLLHNKQVVRADSRTDTATDADILVKLQSCNPFYVGVTVHWNLQRSAATMATNRVTP